MLTEEMIRLISTYTIGCVATVRPDGGPAVSPKATFLVIDARTLAFANIRSEGTVENLRRHSDVEVSFIDIFGRLGCRVRGHARYTTLIEAQEDHRRRFKAGWPDLYRLIRGIILIDVIEAASLSSPSYDVGAVESELVEHWLGRYAAEIGFDVTKRTLELP